MHSSKLVWLKAVLILALVGCGTGCQSIPLTEEQNERAIGPSWEELLERHSSFVPRSYRGEQDDSLAEEHLGRVSPRAHLPLPTSESEALLADRRFARLPLSLRQNPQLAYYALSRSLTSPERYQGGVYGLIGSAKFFMASTESIADYDHLYAVMVRVLSEKFGCFMTAKVNRGNLTRVTCRDKRQVVFWRSLTPDLIQFYARQFDSDGYEIAVKKKQIVRISQNRVI